MKKKEPQVYFVGAGPGDPDLITIKGRKCIESADLVLYTGSLVPKALVACARKEAKVVDSSSMTLDETHAMMVETIRSGGKVARVHTGDPSLYGAIREQMVLLERDAISYEIIPGVTVAFAAAAAAGVSFTLPEKVQTLIFTRLEGRTPVPDKERLRELARHNASLAIYLSSANPEGVAKELIEGGYPEETPVIVAYRVGWPDERILRASIGDLAKTVKEAGIRQQAVFLILPGQEDDPHFSRLYSPGFSHGCRE
ncbi:MAG: precorrin-4 C(11)-methyltransferase [Desulfatiglans sp.]|jgi:precorrin-4/cobalt-precorrin-4 C11-methyltransferase|nr:precorrin-4 C(11)-methyltransferase [Thermodesulfobacteriota bacterium]MEE4353003.1 precorrin-4 C(11)-methyltransferase [Desulfatiglans sp.]